MRKSKYSEERIIRILREIEAGARLSETCRKHGVGEAAYFVWKANYAGMEVSQVRHLKGVEFELSQPK